MPCLQRLDAPEANNWQIITYNGTTSSFKVESWRHTTLCPAPCHCEHGVARCIPHSVLLHKDALQSPSVKYKNFLASDMHSAWGCASQTLCDSQGGAHLSKLWPNTGNWGVGTLSQDYGLYMHIMTGGGTFTQREHTTKHLQYLQLSLLTEIQALSQLSSQLTLLTISRMSLLAALRSSGFLLAKSLRST